MAKIKRARKARAADLPESERAAQQRAFDLYASNSFLPAEDLLRGLMELGLAGGTRHERWAVDRMCSQVYFALMQEKASADEIKPAAPRRSSKVPCTDINGVLSL